jgi:hypothetical protein
MDGALHQGIRNRQFSPTADFKYRSSLSAISRETGTEPSNGLSIQWDL